MKPEEAVQELGAKNSEFRVKMEELKKTVEMLSKPDGKTKANPARTCRDIKSYYPDTPSGNYWLDPNRGCSSDAIQVHCNFTMEEVITCVKPRQQMAIKKNYWSELTHARKWFVEDHNLGNIEYEADMSQLTYLQYLSREAFQTVTVHCKNHAVYFDNKAGNHKSGMHFMGTKRTEFTPTMKNSKRVVFEDISDGCKHRRNSWESTVLRFRTSKFVRLPIVDVAPVKQDKSSMFGLELGPVCFV